MQRYFWDKTAEFTIVPTRMPDCMRRHSLGSAPKDLPVEIYAPGNGAWIVKFGDKLFVTETRNCEGFARLDAAPGGGMGPLVGTFRTRNGELAAVPAPRSEGPAAPAAPATTVPAAQ